MDYKDYLDFGLKLAEEAGQIIADNLTLSLDSEWKGDHTPVTETDLRVNKLTIERIKAAYPNHGILGEEENYHEEREMLWVVDPIDGTMPYDLGMPISTFCLALTTGGQPIVAIVNDPFTKRVFYATKGGGSFVNGKKISVSGSSSLVHSYVGMAGNMHNSKTKNTGELFETLEALNARVVMPRSFVYSAMFVAAGQSIGAIMGKGRPWDAACPKLIIEEAGGKVTTVLGGERRYDQEGDGLLVSNGLVHDQLLEIVKR